MILMKPSLSILSGHRYQVVAPWWIICKAKVFHPKKCKSISNWKAQYMLRLRRRTSSLNLSYIFIQHQKAQPDCAFIHHSQCLMPCGNSILQKLNFIQSTSPLYNHRKKEQSYINLLQNHDALYLLLNKPISSALFSL